jgi:hypothetical protein
MIESQETFTIDEESSQNLFSLLIATGFSEGLTEKTATHKNPFSIWSLDISPFVNKDSTKVGSYLSISLGDFSLGFDK